VFDGNERGAMKPATHIRSMLKIRHGPW